VIILSRLVDDLAAHGAGLRRAWPYGADRLLLDLVLPQDESAAGQWFGDGARAAAVAAATARAAAARDVTVLGSTGVVVQHAGADRRLRPLHALVARGGALVAHRPERRGVVRLRGPHGATTYAKVVRPERLAALAAGTTAAAAALAAAGHRPGDPQVRVPKLIANEPADGVLISQELAGPTLHELLLDPLLHATVPAACRTIGAALARLHRAPLPPAAPEHGARDELAVTRHWLTAAGDAGASSLDTRDLLAELDAMLTQPNARPALVHRDLHDKQLVVASTACIGILDVDLAAAGEPALDLANLLVHLELRAAQGVVPLEVARAGAQAVLSGYDPDEEVLRRLPAYDLAARLRLVGVYAFRPASADAARLLLPALIGAVAGPCRR